MTKYKCETTSGEILYGKTPTWFGDPLPTYVELTCTCGTTYSRDLQRALRDTGEYCSKCLTKYPVFKYIQEDL